MTRYIKMLPLAILLVLVSLATFSATAFAAGAATGDEGSLLDLARPMIDAIKDGRGWLAAALGVVLLLSAARRYTPEAWKLGRFFRSDIGGMLSAFLLAFAGAVATSAATFATGGTGMTLAILLAALKVGAFAIGGFVALHKLATWFTATAWYQSKAPAWLKAGLAFLLALVGSSAIAKAEAAGKSAVEAHPGAGVAAVAGKPTEVL